jgi:hypothetical protein
MASCAIVGDIVRVPQRGRAGRCSLDYNALKLTGISTSALFSLAVANVLRGGLYVRIVTSVLE